MLNIYYSEIYKDRANRDDLYLAAQEAFRNVNIENPDLQKFADDMVSFLSGGKWLNLDESLVSQE